jgi:hypothetical protein
MPNRRTGTQAHRRDAMMNRFVLFVALWFNVFLLSAFSAPLR